MRIYDAAGVAVPEVLLPNPDIDPSKWSVVACDQYTSQPAYWQDVAKTVGGSKSTLHLIYPEVYLGEKEPDKRIEAIRRSMGDYLASGALVGHDGIVYVERHAGGRVRKGLVLCVDLERYDFQKGSSSLIRATEGTIVERLPPRIKIRQGAPLELPHIMVLIDDPGDTVIGPLGARKATMPKLYDFDLMLGAGHLTGYLLEDRGVEESVVRALEALGDPDTFCAKYGVDAGTPVLLYAMGDGNHSLATAKAIWESTKEKAGGGSDVMSSPTRYALVEIVNLHDASLIFEPIHRVVFGLAAGADLIGELTATYAGRIALQEAGSRDEMKERVLASTAERQRFGILRDSGYSVAEVTAADHNLPVGTLQAFLDPFMKAGKAKEIDYVHGTGPVDELGRKPGNMGFFLPPMNKHDLFKSVIVDGALPRKTFSMGEAEEKRFYMECRKLTGS